jgi:hypothetical protein
MENDTMPRFTRENTEGYSDTQLAVMNEWFDDAAHLPPEAWDKMSDIERKLWKDHCAEQVLEDLLARPADNQ